MAVQPNRPNRGLHVRRSSNVLDETYIKQCKDLQERILKRRNGELLPSSVDDIRAMREGRIR